MSRRRFGRSMMTTVALVAALALCGCTLPGPLGHADPGPKVLFFDDFDGPAGAPPAAHWRYDVGGGGWGNDELQVYTDSPANASLDGDGNLAIIARGEADQRITSARLTTRGTMDFTYGRAEARIAVPAGAGLHPAFWLLGSNVDTVGWPQSGEIDVIETLNDARNYHLGVHAPKPGSERGQEVSTSAVAPHPLAGEFRTYWVERSPGRIVMGIDHLPLFTVTPAELASPADWVFDAPFFLLLNLAVGGSWPGPPDASTPNPSIMLVDWVKVTEL
ncbi:glycoside hydrolase family 16 protein [[Mycobacterium] wendilense]|uniref:Glycoside hydrolase family 16 protein n=1 Tax=[Mycobacterium] wendilense TaxID=3064284 RepID=A0ABM9MEK4_9MYCO|nr:glycoside hydrolase family 16 protein [Mycolicibacterium sp. MU0050]CAJ1583350.1 glycoside hydrolase family 16 protein [Mycolicibacterium sp. MU0050]